MFVASQYFFGFPNYILILLINERIKIDIKYAKCIFKMNANVNDNGSSSSTKKNYKNLCGALRS